MEKFRDDPILQEAACYAIRTLATCHPNSEMLVEFGAGSLIQQCMVRHLDDEGVQKAACSAVWSLCGTEGNGERLWKAGLAQSVIQAMQRHPRVAKIQEYGCGVIRLFGYVGQSLIHCCLC